jgi:hypothetical protein
MKALRGWTSGLANPYFVIDAPGGGGKIPLIPDYVESFDENEVVLRNFRGERYVYRQPANGDVPVTRTDPEYLFDATLRAPSTRPRTTRAANAGTRKRKTG